MRSILALMLSSGLGQVLGVLITPILSRIYSKEAFGQLGTIVALSGVLAVFSSLKTEQLMIQGSGDDYGRKIITGFQLIIANTTIFCVAALVAFLVFNYDIFLLFAIVIGAALVASFSVVRVYLSVNGRFKESAILNAKRGALQPACQLAFWFLNRGLILGWLLSLAIPVIKYRKEIRFSVSLNPYKKLKGLWDKVAKITFGGALSEITVTFVMFSTFYLYSAADAGFVAMVYRVLGFPVILVSRSVADYMLPIYKKAYLNRSDNRAAIKPISFCLACSLAISLIFIFIPDEVYIKVLGEEWLGIGKYFAVLAPLFSARLLSIAISSIYIAFSKEGGYLIFSVLLVLGYAVLMLCSSFYKIDFDNYVFFMSLYGTSCYLIYVVVGLFILYGARNENN